MLYLFLIYCILVKKNFIVSGTAINIPNCANHNSHVPLYELPAIDKKDIGLNSVANIETDVTHHGIVPSPLKYSFAVSFLEKCNPANNTNPK